MAVTATRTITVGFTDSINGSNTFNAASNGNSPGAIDIYTLTSGANTITVPTGGSTVKGATIVPPSGNTLSITLKGASGDTGVEISKTDPTSIAFETAPANFVLTNGGTTSITGLRIIWS